MKALFLIMILPSLSFALPNGLLEGDGFGYIDENGTNVLHIDSMTNITTLQALNVASSMTVTDSIQQGMVKSCSLGLVTDSNGVINACVASDQSLKTDVVELSVDLGIIERLRPVNYKWIDQQGRDAQLHAGFIAQEVEAVFPEAVVSAGQDLKGLDQSAFNALVIKALQEIRAQLDPAGKK